MTNPTYAPKTGHGTNPTFATDGSAASADVFDYELSDLPNSIGSCVTWLDAADATTMFVDKTQTDNVSIDGDYVVEWQDKSAASVPAHMQLVSATLSNAPLYKTSIQNGLPCVRFLGDAANNRLASYTGLEDVLADYSASGLTIAFVAAPKSGGATAGTFISTCKNIASQSGFYIRFDPFVGTQFYFSVVEATATANEGWRYDTSLLSEDTFDLFIFRAADSTPDTEQCDHANGSTSLTTVESPTNTIGTPALPSSHTSTSLVLGSNYDNGAFGELSADVCELIIFNKDLTDAEVEILATYLRGKWDL